MTNLGGGIYNTEELTVSECYIVNNTAAGPNGFGGGIYTVGGKLTLKNSTVADNIATRGAGLFANSETRVIGSTISGNSASNQGGGIESYDVTLDILQSTITNNSTVNGAGGVPTQRCGADKYDDWLQYYRWKRWPRCTRPKSAR